MLVIPSVQREIRLDPVAGQSNRIKIISLWASKLGNTEHMDSVIYIRRNVEAFGQPVTACGEITSYKPTSQD